MKNDKILLLFSLILLAVISLSIVSATDSGLNDDSNHTLGENDNIKISSYSSLKYSLGDSENNDLNDGADLGGTDLNSSDNDSNLFFH